MQQLHADSIDTRAPWVDLSTDAPDAGDASGFPPEAHRSFHRSRFQRSHHEDAGWFLSDVGDAIADIATSAIDELHKIPGMDWIGDELKDFAGSAVGKIVLGAMTTAMYGPLSTMLGPMVGPQLAAVVFAFPGLVQGDDFSHAWVSGFVSRVKQTAQMVGGPAADEMMKSLQPAIDACLNDPTIKALIAGAVDVQKLADSLGIREDVAQYASDLIKRVDSIGRDAVPELILPNGLIFKNIPAKPGKRFDIATGKEINPVRPQASRMSVAQVQQARAQQKRAGQLQAGTGNSGNRNIAQDALAAAAASSPAPRSPRVPGARLPGATPAATPRAPVTPVIRRTATSSSSSTAAPAAAALGLGLLFFL